MYASYHLHAFSAPFVFVRFRLFFIHPLLINLCFIYPSFTSPSHLHACVHLFCGIGRFQLDRSLCPPFPPSLSLSLSLSGRLQRNWSLGGSREEPGKGGTKGRPSAAITTPHHLPPPPFFPPSVPSPLFPLPTGQRPKLRLQTRKWAH